VCVRRKVLLKDIYANEECFDFVGIEFSVLGW